MRKVTLTGMVALLVAGSPWFAAAAHHEAHPSEAVHAVEVSAAKSLLARTEALNAAFTAYCASDAQDTAAVKQQWHQTMLSWMALQGQERGPAKALEQSWNVQFWPDKKNTTGRKMLALTQRENALTAQEIARQSVTVQGLGALEWLLYDDASRLTGRASSCDTAIAIADNLQKNAQTIADAWTINPWRSLDDKLWVSEYLSLLSNQLDFSMKKLSRPLASIGKPRPYFAESWRSQTSLANLNANIAAMRALYLANGQGLDAMLRAKGNAALADRVLRHFDNLLATWPPESSLFDALQTKQGYRMALAQYNKLERLKSLLQEDMAVELGVVIGFNATDGD